MLLQLGSIGCISEDERAKDVDVKVAEVRNNSDCVVVVQCSAMPSRPITKIL